MGFTSTREGTSSRSNRTPGTEWCAFRAKRTATRRPKPSCILRIGCTTWPATKRKQEIFATVEYPPQVVVYRKDATGEDQPLRTIEGDDTGLDAPHGIAVDEKDRLLFVNTWGHRSNAGVAGTGKWFPPAIKVYPLDSNGDVKPLRVITGDKTELDWPAAMKFDPNSGDLYIANDIGQSVLVFANAAKAQGDVAPARVIHGPSTRLQNPRVWLWTW